MIVFAQNYRGFKNLEIDLSKFLFLVGDNSSGKSSILYLIQAILENELSTPPQINEGYGSEKFDYFSPYFDNADVTFGFITEGYKGAQAAKVITVSKSGEYPEIIRCSYWTPNLMVTIRKMRGKVRVRFSESPPSCDAAAIMKSHLSPGGFDKIVKRNTGGIASVLTLINAMKMKEEKFENLFSSALSTKMPDCQLVSPLRALPERFYSFKRKIDNQGSHFATMWMDFVEARGEVLGLIDKFGKESGLFDSFKVRKIVEGITSPPLVVTVEKNGKDFALNQVGIGVSQVVPILTDAVYALGGEDRLLLVMQPELHLHPVAQSAFGSFIYAMGDRGLKGVFETHSSFLMDRFRSELRDSGSGKKVNAEILFCENTAAGNLAHHIYITDDGSIRNEPSYYHKFFIDELMRTMF